MCVCEQKKMDYSRKILNLVKKACKIVDKPLSKSQIEIVYQPLHHEAKALPKGKMAVYTFVYQGNEFLKIGRAGAKSKARYQSHHYYVRSGKSTLARSLVNDPNMPMVNVNNVTDWVKNNCERYDVILDASLGKMLLNYIEGMLHYKYLPRYEG